MIDPRQIRAARALLDWSQADLAEAVQMAASSVKAIENGRATPRGETLALIAAAFESNGVAFTPGCGVRLKTEIVTVHNGRDATAALLDTIYAEAHASPDREVLICGLDERHSEETDGAEMLKSHIGRLKAAGIRERILIRHGDRNFLNDANAYRWLPAEYFSRAAPLYVFGDKIAFHTGSLKRNSMIIHAATVASHMRKLFSLVWDHASTNPSPMAGGYRR